METQSFAQKQQQAHELRSVERLTDELRLARLSIADHQLRETTLKEEIQRIDRNAKETISAIKEEAVTKAADVVEKVLADDFAALCKQLGIEPQGAPEMPTSLRIAETMKLLAEDKVRLDWLIRGNARVIENPTGSFHIFWGDSEDIGAEWQKQSYPSPRAAIDAARKA